VFMILLLLLLPASFVSAKTLPPLIGILFFYALVGFYFSLRSKTKGSWNLSLVQPFASFCFHMAYGAGTLFGLIYLFRQPSTVPIRPGLPIQEKVK
jgi:hypothetical protein